MPEEAKTGIHLRRPRAAAAARPGDIVDGYEITGATGTAEKPVITRYLHLQIRDAKHARRDLQASYRSAQHLFSIMVHDALNASSEGMFRGFRMVVYTGYTDI